MAAECDSPLETLRSLGVTPSRRHRDSLEFYRSAKPASCRDDYNQPIRDCTLTPSRQCPFGAAADFCNENNQPQEQFASPRVQKQNLPMMLSSYFCDP